MNPYEMVVIIVVIATIGNIFRARYRYRHFERRKDDQAIAAPPPENVKLREEVQTLKQRIQVLERIAVEKENSLTREIEQLRDR
ncbi:MAG: hypothetical protein ABR588_10845 [Sphingomicrobium sp.]|nr:hypothetical protein [Sphingomonadales bacterium]